MPPLGDVVSPSKEKVEPQECREARYLSLEHIEHDSGRIISQGVGSDVGSTKAVFRAGDVLYGKLRPYLNKVCIPDFDGICSTDILVFPHVSHLDPRYLMRFLMQRRVVEYAHHHSAGVQLPRVSFGKLAELDLPLPPLAEQKRIVAKVEALLARVNVARERLAKAPALLKRFRQSVLAAAFSGAMTADWREREPESTVDDLLHTIRERRDAETAKLMVRLPAVTEDEHYWPLPDGWAYVRLAELCSLIADIDHNMPKAVSNDCGVKFLSAKDLLDDGTLNLTVDVKHISEKDYLRLSRKVKPQRGDIIYSRIGACLGKARLVETDERFLVSYSCCTVRPLAVDALYLTRFLDSGVVLVRAREDAQSIGVPDLGLQKIKEFPVPLPPLAEQREIVRRVEAMFALADKIEARVKAATVRVEKITQSILAKAFRGELVPTEAELARQEGRDYEPAAVLLDRIRAACPEPRASRGRRARAVDDDAKPNAKPARNPRRPRSR